MTIPITPNVDIKSTEVKGLAGVSNASAVLTPTTSYQTLVAAPSSAIRRVSQIIMKNYDAAVTAVFSIKIVRSGSDYNIISISLAPGEKFVLEFPFLLDTDTSIQGKVDVTCTGRIIASYIPFAGEMALATFTGTGWATVLTVPASHAYEMLGFVITNTDTTSQNIVIQILDASSNVIDYETRTLAPGANWFYGMTPVLLAGYKFQVKHGAASKTGAALVSYLEVPS
jgi:hypothetical protein